MMHLRIILLAALAVVGAAPRINVAFAADPRCTFAKIAELPVRIQRNQVIVDGAINGRAVNVMLDTGATSTLIPRPVAERLELSRQKVRGYRIFGVGGETDVESALVDEFRLGDATVKGRRMMVAGDRDPGNDIGVILGEDFFHTVDVEFDLAHNSVRLFRPKNCDDTSLAYWAPKGASEVPIERVSDVAPGIFLTLRINGEPVRALLDSGAWRSVLDRSEAARVGVVAETTGVAPGKASGAGPASVEWWVGHVQSVVVGDESIKDTKILTTDLSKGMRYIPRGSLTSRAVDGAPAMLLGADFLRAHRVLIAHSQQKLYFTYVGGPVFDLTDPTRSSKDADRAITDYDAAIRSNPEDGEAYFRRANTWYEKKEYDRAIADYDAAIRIDPRRASAYSNRAGAKVAKGDYVEGAADATRAIEIDPRMAPAFLTRGTARRRSGDLEGAIADYARAVEIDPRLASAHNQLAWVLATAERPAVRDGRRAVESALAACELTQWKSPKYVDTLAAAYARAGNFEAAVKWQRKAIEDSRNARDENAPQRLRSYEEGKAWPVD